jgi:hypothetical protein
MQDDGAVGSSVQEPAYHIEDQPLNLGTFSLVHVHELGHRADSMGIVVAFGTTIAEYIAKLPSAPHDPSLLLPKTILPAG